MNNSQLQIGNNGNENAIVNSIILNGDISKLAPNDKASYYMGYCQRLGLDPFCKPFQIIRFQNGKESLYCTREGAQQLAKLQRVSHRIIARERIEGAYIVTAQAFLPDGRQTESIGAVSVENLKGTDYCNALMKCETKAKRRATLDLLGLGVLDETETDSIQNAKTSIIDITNAREMIPESKQPQIAALQADQKQEPVKPVEAQTVSQAPTPQPATKTAAQEALEKQSELAMTMIRKRCKHYLKNSVFSKEEREKGNMNLDQTSSYEKLQSYENGLTKELQKRCAAREAEKKAKKAVKKASQAEMFEEVFEDPFHNTPDPAPEDIVYADQEPADIEY